MIPLPGYDVLDILAESDARVLVRARPAEGGDPVVLKLLSADPPAPTDVARLHHEYALGTGLPERAVVRPLRVEQVGARTGLVLSDVAGITLASAVGPDGLDLDAFLRIAGALADALRCLHEAGIMHRDVKPANVVVDKALTQARLIDLGLATRLPRVHSEAVPPALLEGTLAYMAPEQTGRTNRSVDHRSDLYALGVTLYQMLTGRLPFGTADALELVHCHLAVVPPEPAVVRPAVPRTVSDIVMCLLAKAPEDRYASAAGLGHDLAAATAAPGTPLVLRSADVPTRLEVPGHLYGRASETAPLAAAVADASAGGKALMLLSGPAGIGKTALVGELHAPLAAHGGRMLTGKFDQFSRNVPYASVVEAFGGLARQLLAEPAVAVAGWRAALDEALGPNLGVVTEVVPELRLVVGDVPPPAALGPVEAANRLALAFASFVGVFARAARPLVLFLDDLHWADAASLKLLADLLADPGVTHLLVVGAYRPAEVSESHPLTLTLAAVPPEAVHRLAVGPLDRASVTELLTDALRTDPGALGALLHDRSGGNPFFVRQLLDHLAAEGLVTFGGGGWEWDLPAIEARGLTDDVVAFMVGRLAGLPDATRAALRPAALIGNRFDLATLARVLDTAPDAAAQALWPAIRAGLLLTIGEEHELVGAGLTARQATYRFLHDRVQQACHATVPAGELPALHARVGSVLRERLGPDDDGVFEVVEHLNTAADLAGEEGPGLDLALLNLRAARRAKGAAAFQAATELLSTARRRLPPDAWEIAYEATYEIHALLGESLGVLGRVEEVETTFQALLAAARTEDDTARAWLTLGKARFICGHMPQSQDAFKSGLAALRIDVTYSAEAAGALLARLRDPSAAAGLAETSAGGGRAALSNELLDMAAITAYFLLEPDFAYLAALGVQQILGSGTFSQSGLSIVFLAMELARTGHLDSGLAFAHAATELSARDADDGNRGRVTMFAWSYCLVWTHDFDSYVRTQRDLFWTCQNAGTTIYANYTLVWEFMAVQAVTRDLAELVACIDRVEDHGRRYAPQLLAMWPLVRDMAEELMTTARDPYDRVAALAEIEAVNLIGAWVALMYLTFHHALLGEYRTAHEFGTRSSGYRQVAGGMPTTHGLLSNETGDAIACARLGLLEEAEAAAARLAVVTDVPPYAYATFGSLAAAEIARARGNPEEAAAAYLRAVDQAAQHGYTLLQGWAHELLGRLHDERGRTGLAAVHLREACALFHRCGAGGKVAQVERDFPGLTPARARATSGAARAAGEDIGGADLPTVLRASRAIAAETSYARVAERIVEVAVEISGAVRGDFLAPAGLPRDGAFTLPIVRNDELVGAVRLEHPDGEPPPDRVALLRLLSAQMAISLENARLYEGLEAQVAQRSADLAATLEELRLTQDQIVTSEKLAALGSLVAGVAHEVGTPVGVAVTAASHLAVRVAEFESSVAAGPLRRSALEAFVGAAADAGGLILTNLTRAAELVQSFKQVAVDRSSEARRTFGARAYVEQVVASLRPQLVQAGHEVTVDCDPGLVLETYPGALAQVLTNLVLNSVVHGYPDGRAGRMRVVVEADGGRVRISYADDGVGIRGDLVPSVFDPFVTTRRRQGGSGLGLHIVRNLVTHQLGGTIVVDGTPGQGVRFTIEIPAVLP